jgi:Icc-related predicted phosphoesterase
VTNLQGWAFNADEESIWKHLDAMGRVDILVAHSPPRGLLDRVDRGAGHIGLASLRKYITKYQPRYVICGHVHEGYGIIKEGTTEVINVSMCDSGYNMVNPPWVLEV